MPATGEDLKRSLRETLADSHVVAVAIGVLLLWTLDSGFRAVLYPLPNVIEFCATAIAILGLPYVSFTGEGRILLMVSLMYVFSALITLTGAWILARCVYGVGPLRALLESRNRLTGGSHV